MSFKDTEGIVAPENAQRETHPTLELGQGVHAQIILVPLHAHYSGHRTLIRFISSIALSPWDKFN